MVSGERFSPLSLSCPRGRQPAGGLPLQGEVPAFRVDPESLGFSEDLSSLPPPPPSGDILVRFGPDLPASQVLFEGSGSASLGYRRDVVPVVGSTSLRVPSVQSAPSNTSESSSGQSRPPSHSPSLASEALVTSPSVTTGGFSEEPSASSRPSSSAYLPLPTPSSGSSASFTLAAFRQRGQEAGRSERAADFAAQSLRPSTRCSYDARLAGFLIRCSLSACDPLPTSLSPCSTRIVLHPLSEATGRSLLPSMQDFLMALQFLILLPYQTLEVVLSEAPTFSILDSFLESPFGTSYLDLFALWASS